MLDHLVFFFQVLIFGVGLLGLGLCWLAYSSNKSISMLSYSLQSTFFTLLILLSTVIVYFRINQPGGVTESAWNLIIWEQIPRHGLIFFTVFLAHSLHKHSVKVIGNITYALITIIILVITFLPGGMEYDPNLKRINYGLLYHISNILQLVAILYSMITAFVLVSKRLAHGSQMHRLMTLMNILNLIFIPGYIFDFAFTPIREAQTGTVFPFFTFFRLHFLFISLSSIIIITRSLLLKPTVIPEGQVHGDLGGFVTRFALSDRESEILQLVCDGLGNKMIADKLFISLGTVKTHVYNIFQKTGAANRVELVNLTRGRSA